MSDRDSPTGVVHTETPRMRAYPSNVTFDELIRRNKRKSVLLVIAMLLLALVVGGTIGALLGAYAGGTIGHSTEASTGSFTRPEGFSIWPSVFVGVIAAAIVAGVGAVWSYFGGSNAILRMSGARPIEKAEDPQLYNVVEELALAAGIPTPPVYVIEDEALNAFATGRDPEHSAVAITRGLRQTLNRDELAGVIAHEISHIRHYDIRFMMLMATMVGLIVFACDAMFRMVFYGGLMGGGRRGGRGGGHPIVLVIMLIALILAIIAPILAMAIRFALSRQREFLADAGAVELTRYPQGLIGALEKLGSSRQPLQGANRATAHLFIVNPLKNATKGQGHNLRSAFRTHPPLGDRIERIRALLH